MYASDEVLAKVLEIELKQSQGFLGRMIRDQVERFIYVMTPHPYLLGPVNKRWLICRFGEDPANNVLQFANSIEGPWESAKDLPDLMQRLQKLKPLPGGAKPPPAPTLIPEGSNKASQGIDVKAARQPSAVIDQYWVRTSEGKRGGPFTKEQITKAIVAGKIPEGSEVASSPDGPWQKIRIKKGG